MTTRDTPIDRKPDSSSYSSWSVDRSHVMGVVGGVAAGLAYPVGLAWAAGAGVGALVLGSPKERSKRSYFTRSGLIGAVIAGAMAFSHNNAIPQLPELYMNDTHTVITVPTNAGDKEFVRDGDQFMLREEYLAHHERLVRDRENASLDSLLARER